MTVTVEAIKRTVAHAFGLSLTGLLSKRRSRSVARPRQIAMYLTQEMTLLSTPAIGKKFGGRDHTTVIHAVRTIEALMQRDPDFKKRVDQLREEALLTQSDLARFSSTSLEDVAVQAHRVALRQAKRMPGSLVVGDVSEMRDALKAEFNEIARESGEGNDGQMVELLTSPAGSWSLLLIAPDTDRAQLIASGDDWRRAGPSGCGIKRITKKPDAPAPAAPPPPPLPPTSPVKERECAMCGDPFTSHHFGERVCGRCKNSKAWKNPDDARLQEARV